MLASGSRPSAERAVLVAAARAFLEGSPLLAHWVPEALDWEGIRKCAEREGLAALLWAVAGALPVPAPVRERLRTAWVSGQRQHLLGVAQLSEVLSAFQRRGVPVMPLKGPVLAAGLYRDPGLRPFTDLDLLIRAEDLPHALEILSALGYRYLDAGHSLSHALAWRHAAPFVQPDRSGFLPIDVHWELLDYPGVTWDGGIDHREIWDRAVRIEGWAEPIWGLSAEDLLVYLALHWAVHHAFSGLLWQLDLALILRRYRVALDWGAMAERARRWRIQGTLYVALSETAAGFDVEVPPSFLAGLRPPGLRRAAVRWLRGRDAEGGSLDYLIPLLLLDRPSDLLGALARNAVPAAGWIRSRYARGSLLGGYLAHYARFGRVCARTARAALGR